MSKKDAEREKEEEKDLEDEEEEDEDEEEEEEEETASARPARARARARRDHDAHDDDHGHGHDEEDEDVDADDPYWWTPHAVMSLLVVLGLAGFFGAFNRFVPKGVYTAAAEKAGILPGASEPAHGSSNSHSAAPTPSSRPKMAPDQTGELYGAKHLLVQYKGSMRAGPNITRTEDEAKARATEAMKKARGGAKFEDIVKEYSDEPGAAQRGGDLGKFRKGQMVPQFQEAVEKMKVGEISELVKTPFGYHVIQRTQ